ncbi:hypothetical protein Patl1_37658 [Pistacia atlantica]|nr:hypothetical protein Patl1_37658 [Pistacia atlantica]
MYFTHKQRQKLKLIAEADPFSDYSKLLSFLRVISLPIKYNITLPIPQNDIGKRKPNIESDPISDYSNVLAEMGQLHRAQQQLSKTNQNVYSREYQSSVYFNHQLHQLHHFPNASKIRLASAIADTIFLFYRFRIARNCFSSSKSKIRPASTIADIRPASTITDTIFFFYRLRIASSCCASTEWQPVSAPPAKRFYDILLYIRS